MNEGICTCYIKDHGAIVNSWAEIQHKKRWSWGSEKLRNCSKWFI